MGQLVLAANQTRGCPRRRQKQMPPNALGDNALKTIAHELVDSVRRNTSLDWQLKTSVPAKLRVLVKRILRNYKYPPDDLSTGEYTGSVNKVLEQAELLADYWTEDG